MAVTLCSTTFPSGSKRDINSPSLSSVKKAEESIVVKEHNTQKTSHSGSTVLRAGELLSRKPLKKPPICSTKPSSEISQPFMSSTVASLTLKKEPVLPSRSQFGSVEPLRNTWKLSTPKVSIIVPLYNKEKYIRECIKSILDQSFNDFELIVINDGSTDNSSGAIPRGDDRIHISHTVNHGVSYARNEGLSRARGKYVLFVDADDHLEPHALFKMVEAMDGVDLVIGSFKKSGAMTTLVQNGDRISTIDELSDYVMENLLDPSRNQLINGCWAKLFRNSIIKKNGVHFPIFMRTAEDMGFNYTYLLHCERVKFIQDVVYTNRKHFDHQSLSTRYNKRDPYGLFGFVIGLSYVRRFLRDFFLEVDIDHAVANSYIYHMILYFVRICGQAGFWESLRIIKTTMKQAEFKRRLLSYKPGEGNYKLIPWLLNRGWVWPTVLACRLKA